MFTKEGPDLPDWVKKIGGMAKAGIMTPKMEMAAGMFNILKSGTEAAIEKAKGMLDDMRKRGMGVPTPEERPRPAMEAVPGAFGIGAMGPEQTSTWRKIQQLRSKDSPEAKTAKNTEDIRNILDERLPERPEDGEGGVEGV